MCKPRVTKKLEITPVCVHAPPHIFRINNYFALQWAVSQRKYCCSLKIKQFNPHIFWLPMILWAGYATESLYRCTTCQRCLKVNSYMRKSALAIVTWSEPLKIRSHVIDTEQRATVERRTRNVWVCTRRSWHEWTASSSLHHTRTVNLDLVQCDCRVPHR